MSTKLIEDEFTDMPVSRQRKWQLRHPEQQQAMMKRYRETSPDYKKLQSERQQRWNEAHPDYMKQYRKRKMEELNDS